MAEKGAHELFDLWIDRSYLELLIHDDFETAL
jgi:hypothetical protein